jgi:pyrroloquinoline quinone biosynthesis protein E
MKEPCRTCPEKEKDYGGCRCQAYLMTGDASTADPVCDKSPHHTVVTDTLERVKKLSAETHSGTPLFFRDDENSRLLAGNSRSPLA